MWRHFLTITFRSLNRHRGFVLINVTGLATGLAFCILTSLFVWHEWTYDSFHANADRIYRVISTSVSEDGQFVNATDE